MTGKNAGSGKTARLPLLLIGLGGGLLLVAVGVIAWGMIGDRAPAAPQEGAADLPGASAGHALEPEPVPAAAANPLLPETIGGASLTRVASGAEALAEIDMLHGLAIDLLEGAVGVYGGGIATLWVSGAADVDEAVILMEAMTASIADGGNPFTGLGVGDFGGTPVYMLDGLGQKHFYFQTGSLIIWLAADTDLAAPALTTTLNFYRGR